MSITMVKLFGLLSAGCLLLGVTLADGTNKLHVQTDTNQPSAVRGKRGLFSALFGAGGESATATEVTTEVLPVYGDPAQPPLHIMYGHPTGLQGPYPPYPVMFVPGTPPVGAHGSYLPLLTYGSHPSASAPSNEGSKYLPPVLGWPEQTAFQPVAPSTTAPTPTKGTKKVVTTTPSTPVDPGQTKSAYLMKLNLTPQEEKELKRLAKQLGVTDFEHLPPFEDVMALLGTTTSGETIKAIREYASTPDGLELIKDYVMSYQPAKRISLGKEPYAANSIEQGNKDASLPTAPPESGGFLSTQLRRLKSLLTFGYFDSADNETPLEGATPEVPSERPFTPNEYPAFEVRDMRDSSAPVAHYLVPIRTLPRHVTAGQMKYASAVPFPYAMQYYPPPVVPHLQDANPFTMRKEADGFPSVPGPDSSQLRFLGVGSPPTDVPAVIGVSSETVPTKRMAPPTSATGIVHTFENTDLGLAVHSTTPAEQQHAPSGTSTTDTETTVATVPVAQSVTPDVLEVAELEEYTTDFILNVLDTEHTT